VYAIFGIGQGPLRDQSHNQNQGRASDLVGPRQDFQNKDFRLKYLSRGVVSVSVYPLILHYVHEYQWRIHLIV